MTANERRRTRCRSSHPPVTDEKDGLLKFMAAQRGALKASVFGLTREQATSTPSVSAINLAGPDQALRELRAQLGGRAPRPPRVSEWDYDNDCGTARTTSPSTTSSRSMDEVAAETEEIVRGAPRPRRAGADPGRAVVPEGHRVVVGSVGAAARDRGARPPRRTRRHRPRVDRRIERVRPDGEVRRATTPSGCQMIEGAE